MIEAVGLAKRYGPVEAVRGVSFTAKNGEITGLLGANGAGKTTTLRMVSSLVRPDAGTARVDGIDVRHAPDEARRHLGILPDSRGLYPRLTAREHLRYFGQLQGLSRTALEKTTARLVEALDMGSIIDRRTAGFSQGERTKVAIARALVHDPGNVILDEPTNGLDVMSTRAMREVIRGLSQAGTCVLFSTHVMQEVSALCDSIVIFRAGQVMLQGTPEQIRAQGEAESLEDAFVRLLGSGEGLA